MKKLFTLIAFAGITAFYACGPSAEEKAKIEQAHQDSIKAAQEMEAQKMAEMEKAKADSMAAVAAAQAKADSIAKAEEEAKAKGGKKK